MKGMDADHTHRVDSQSCLIVTPELELSEITSPKVTSSEIAAFWFWASAGAPALGGSFGDQPYDGVPPPGASQFGIVTFPPGAGNSMHATDSVDLDVIIAGRIVLEIDGGERRVLGAGAAVLLGGAAHSWSNPFDEPCVFVAIALGAHAKSEAQ
jgi:quercetin dioxygenase-like cupin family protein